MDVCISRSGGAETRSDGVSDVNNLLFEVIRTVISALLVVTAVVIVVVSMDNGLLAALVVVMQRHRRRLNAIWDGVPGGRPGERVRWRRGGAGAGGVGGGGRRDRARGGGGRDSYHSMIGHHDNLDIDAIHPETLRRQTRASKRRLGWWDLP